MFRRHFATNEFVPNLFAELPICVVVRTKPFVNICNYLFLIVIFYAGIFGSDHYRRRKTHLRT